MDLSLAIFSVPDELKLKFANFPPTFKNTEVVRNDIGDYMKNYANENEMLKHPQRMLISIFMLENGTVLTLLFNFILFFWSFVIMSEVGVHQGDPEGPPLFSDQIMDIIDRLSSLLSFWYLDDGNLGDRAIVGLADLPK